jgi:hypothetical protein
MLGVGAQQSGGAPKVEARIHRASAARRGMPKYIYAACSLQKADFGFATAFAQTL